MATFSKAKIMDEAVVIAKAYARSGGSNPIDSILRTVYEELKRINEEQD